MAPPDTVPRFAKSCVDAMNAAHEAVKGAKRAIDAVPRELRLAASEEHGVTPSILDDMDCKLVDVKRQINRGARKEKDCVYRVSEAQQRRPVDYTLKVIRAYARDATKHDEQVQRSLEAVRSVLLQLKRRAKDDFEAFEERCSVSGPQVDESRASANETGRAAGGVGGVVGAIACAGAEVCGSEALVLGAMTLNPVALAAAIGFVAGGFVSFLIGKHLIAPVDVELVKMHEANEAGKTAAEALRSTAAAFAETADEVKNHHSDLSDIYRSVSEKCTAAAEAASDEAMQRECIKEELVVAMREFDKLIEATAVSPA